MGCGGSVAKKGEGSPCLNEYFDKLREFTNEEITDLKQLAQCKDKKDIENQKILLAQIKSKRQAFVKVRAKLLEDSFNHHDVSGDGKLSEEESKILFTHITSEQRGHDKILANECVRKELLVDLVMNKFEFDAIADPDEATLKKEADDSERKEARLQEADVKKKIDSLLADYQKNKVQRDHAAFLVLDVSKDGRINKTEFIQAFDPSHPLHSAFMSALGLNTEVEVKNFVGEATAVKDKDDQKMAAENEAGETKLDKAGAAPTA